MKNSQFPVIASEAWQSKRSANPMRLLRLWLAMTLAFTSCMGTITINKPEFRPFLQHQPVSQEELSKIHKSSPKDSVLADLLQAFALMRKGDIESKAIQKQISGLLMTSVSTFEDLNDPVNFSKAFSADEDKPFRGRPHERMYASFMTGVFELANNNCDLALPYFKNAEFLDARFQKLPFGTDAPLVYALSLRCLHEKGVSLSDQQHARNGIYKSVRFLSLQEPLIDLLIETAKSDMRTMAISNRMAYMIMEVGLYYSLLSAPNDSSIEELIDYAAKNAQIFTAAIKTNFEEEYKAKLSTLIKEQANIQGQSKKEGLKALEELAFFKVDQVMSSLKDRLIKLAKESNFNKALENGLFASKSLSEKIIVASLSPKMILNFTGMGPSLIREGGYNEISTVKTSPDGTDRPIIREKMLATPTSCGFHRTKGEDFAVVLCANRESQVKEKDIKTMPSYELLSLSRKAKMIQGRKFEQVLKGRAQFKAATEEISKLSLWGAFFLFHLGNSIMDSCRRSQDDSCNYAAYAVYGAAAITALFSGIVWLVGKPINPSADSRYVHLMYESSWLSI